MKKVQREEILDYVTYGDRRADIQAKVLPQKAARRIDVGPYLTFLFENADTVRYQVQEMMRTERLVREAEIQHEIDTYNELLGDDGELGATLLIGIPTPAERDELLRAWLGMPDHWYVELGGGEKVRATYDPRQVGDDRLSSVQYLKFDTRGEVPVAIGCDLDVYTHRTELSEESRRALLEDLKS